jgi:hypothetical protein
LLRFYTTQWDVDLAPSLVVLGDCVLVLAVPLTVLPSPDLVGMYHEEVANMVWIEHGGLVRMAVASVYG